MVDDVLNLVNELKKHEGHLQYRRCFNRGQIEYRDTPYKTKVGGWVYKYLEIDISKFDLFSNGKYRESYTYREFSISGLSQNDMDKNQAGLANLIDKNGFQLQSHNINEKERKIILFNESTDKFAKILDKNGITYDKKEGLEVNDIRLKPEKTIIRSRSGGNNGCNNPGGWISMG